MSQITSQDGVGISGNTAEEFRAVLSGCGVYRLENRARIVLTGSDRVRWLNGMVTNNVRDLATGHGIYAFLLNPQGHPQADLYTYNRGESILVDVERGLLDKVLGIFDHYIIMDDVEVTNLTDQVGVVGIAGPQARKILRDSGMDLPDLEPLQFAEITWQGLPITITRHDNPALEAYEAQVESSSMPALWQALTNGGAFPLSAQTLELVRIASGVPRYGQDIRERDLPQETEQARALHFSKGCYVGQEIVERIRSRGGVHRKFSGFYVKGTLPETGMKIQLDGKDIGEVTSVASVPTATGEHNIALGYIRREAAAAGKDLAAGESRLTLAPLPFQDLLKNSGVLWLTRNKTVSP
jgi:folate-binding protein YgfZ